MIRIYYQFCVISVLTLDQFAENAQKFVPSDMREALGEVLFDDSDYFYEEFLLDLRNLRNLDFVLLLSSFYGSFVLFLCLLELLLLKIVNAHELVQRKEHHARIFFLLEVFLFAILHLLGISLDLRRPLREEFSEILSGELRFHGGFEV